MLGHMKKHKKFITWIGMGNSNIYIILLIIRIAYHVGKIILLYYKA